MEGDIRKRKVTVLRSRNNSRRNQNQQCVRRQTGFEISQRGAAFTSTNTVHRCCRDAAEISVTQGGRKTKQPEPGV